jgi:hypothetical protein
MSTPPLVPTPRLRWRVQRAPKGSRTPVPVLEQWWAPDVPSYMITAGQGEWRAVEVVGHVE